MRQFGSGQKDAEQNMAWQKNGRQKNGVGLHLSVFSFSNH